MVIVFHNEARKGSGDLAFECLLGPPSTPERAGLRPEIASDRLCATTLGAFRPCLMPLKPLSALRS